MNLTGKWKGFYNYDIGPDKRNVEFCVDIIDDHGNLSGDCIDSETQEFMNEPLAIDGFFDPELQTISFIKTYPYEYYVDELGDLYFDTESNKHEVEYIGEYEPDSNSFSGTWLIVAEEKLFKEGKIDSIYSGEWYMEREAPIL